MVRRQIARGVSLIEVLLVISVLAILLAGMYQLFDGWAQRAVNREAAAEMLRVQSAAEDYVRANFETFKIQGTGFVPVTMAQLIGGNYLPSGFSGINMFRQPIRVYRRAIQYERFTTDASGHKVVMTDDDGSTLYYTNIEVVSVSDNNGGVTIRVPNKRLLDIAGSGGPNMGLSSDISLSGFTYSGLVTSVYNGWVVNRTDLQAAGYGATPGGGGGYLAAHGIVNNEATDANSQYLYRVAIDGQPQLNRMATNLMMNGQRLEHVGSVVGDQFHVAGNAAFSGVTKDTTGSSAQALTVEDGLRVESTGESHIRMKSNDTNCTVEDTPTGRRISSGTSCDITGGELQVIGERKVNGAAAGDATFNMGTLDTLGTIVTDYTTVRNGSGNGTVQSNGISTFTNVTSAVTTAQQTLLAPTVNVTGSQIDARQFQTGNLNTTAPSYVANDVAVARVSPGPGKHYQALQLDVGNTAEIANTTAAARINASNVLDIEQAAGSYHDNANNQTTVCRRSGGRTYCEPEGGASWEGGQYYTFCGQTGNGYQCNHYRWNGVSYAYSGHCDYTRSVGASGQAYHSESCT